MGIIDYGLYSVSNTYFAKYNSEFFCDNKNENRPYFLSMTDKDGIIWLIPLSSQADNYSLKIESNIHKYGMCLFYHIGKIYGQNRVFLIGNMFPATEKYILKEYTYDSIHYIVQDKYLIKEVKKRVGKYLALVENKKLTPKVDIMAIKADLMNDNRKHEQA